MLHGAPSPKRTVLFSTMSTAQELDLGKLAKEKRLQCSKITTARALFALLNIHQSMKESVDYVVKDRMGVFVCNLRKISGPWRQS